MDSVGIGELPDAAAYGDQGSDTVGNIAKRIPLQVPTLRSLGFARVAHLDPEVPGTSGHARHVPDTSAGEPLGTATRDPLGAAGRLAVASAGRGAGARLIVALRVVAPPVAAVLSPRRPSHL